MSSLGIADSVKAVLGREGEEVSDVERRDIPKCHLMSEIFPTNIDREIDAGGSRRGTACD